MYMNLHRSVLRRLAAAALETLHGHSSRVFEGAITDRLRDAMGR